MKKVLLKGLLVLAVSVCLAGCKYFSSYAAFGMVRSNTAKAAEISFSSFRGRYVFRLKCTDTEEALVYSGSVEEGSVIVSIDNGEGKTELFAVQDGIQEEARLEALEEGTLYIIVETDGKCRHGSFRFRLE